MGISKPMAISLTSYDFQTLIHLALGSLKNTINLLAFEKQKAETITHKLIIIK